MTDEPPKDDIAFAAVQAFNDSGFPFQGSVLSESNRLFSKKRSKWVFEVEESPVSIGSRSVRVDFILSRTDRPWFIVAECKRVGPGRGWVFRRSEFVRRDYAKGDVPLDHLHLRDDTEVVRGVRSFELQHKPVYHQGVVFKASSLGSARGSTNRDAICNACRQVLLGVNGFINQLIRRHELWDGKALLIPVVFTTAPLFVLTEDTPVALNTGDLPAATEVERIPWLWFRQHVSPAVMSQHPIEGSGFEQRLGSTLSRHLDSMYGRTVAVVSSDGVGDFLKFVSQ